MNVAQIGRATILAIVFVAGLSIGAVFGFSDGVDHATDVAIRAHSTARYYGRMANDMADLLERAVPIVRRYDSGLLDDIEQLAPRLLEDR